MDTGKDDHSWSWRMPTKLLNFDLRERIHRQTGVAMTAVTDVIDGQVDAYRDRDLDRYLSFYAEDAIITDGDGNVVMSGLADLRDQYGKSFRANPAVEIKIARRIAVGDYVVDEEHLGNLGDPPRAGEIHAVVAYCVSGSLISRVLLLASTPPAAPADS